MKALLVIDVQYDFLPVSAEDYENGLGGALAVPEGNEIIPVINKLLPQFELVIFTKDWHPENMYAFASNHPGKKPFDKYFPLIQPEVGDPIEDTLWPDHCVAETRGADIHDDIDFSLIKGNFYIFKKGLEKDSHPYSGFSETNLAEFLRNKYVDEVFIVGLATDYCVRDTAIDAVNEGFDTIVIEDGCKPINPDINEVLKIFDEKNISFIESWEIEKL